jgi:hypothetical protein
MPMQSLHEPDSAQIPPARGLKRAALLAADRGLYVLHLTTTLLIVFGWIPAATRMINWYLIVATFVSWLGFGLIFGFGYCVFTDIQARLRRRLGSGEPLDSFVKDVVDRVTGRDWNARHVETVTQLVFYGCAAASFYVNFASGWI